MKRATLVLAVALLFTSACAGILGIRPKASPEHSFEHREHAVAGVHCLSCHDGIQQAGDVGALHLPSTEKCVSCHKKPHDERACNTCHGLPYTREQVTRARDVLRFDHQKHRTTTSADCIRCHADSASGSGVMRPRMAECLSCHGHDEEFTKKDCDGCHIDLRREGTLPDDHVIHDADFAKDHASAAQNDDGTCQSCHAERFCASCHTGGMMPVVPSRLAFDKPRGGGLHRAGFLARHAEESKNAPGLCTTCHAPESCQSCHARSKLDASQASSRNPHPPGWVGLPGSRNDHGQAMFRDPASCEACHGGAGEQLCVKCHQVGAGGGNPHLPGSRPSGDRTRQPCVKCHVGGR